MTGKREIAGVMVGAGENQEHILLGEHSQQSIEEGLEACPIRPGMIR